MSHERYMKLALEEAMKGCGWVNPNPMVGAVIVKDGQVIGKGYHKKFGDLHAERNALASCAHSPQGSTMYVTLEPCCHYGKTPPCTKAIIENGISEVVVGSRDPNPLVAGKGIDILRRHGIQVTTDVLQEECYSLNEVFYHYITQKTPYVVMKYAMTLDGKTATATGKSKWITSEAAREHVHRLRHQYSAITVGIGTVLADDPMLTCRLPDCKNPVRVICDTHLRIPIDSQIVKTAREVKTYIATCCPDNYKGDRLRGLGCDVISVSKSGDHINLKELMTLLGNLEIDSVMLEGGAALHASALQDGIVNKVYAYVAPKIFGGNASDTAVAGRGVDSPDDAYLLKDRRITLLGDDILLEYRM
ncbi:Riboflavin biosynthesis protein RibD [bioreactor metagenome]|uniref:Riboflavin biosynthesis protein RibD n=1 Tax=bioreactor metagenome TaxID=1076179 RepID=A0A644XLT2_9ZZZZ